MFKAPSSPWDLLSLVIQLGVKSREHLINICLFHFILGIMVYKTIHGRVPCINFSSITPSTRGSASLHHCPRPSPTSYSRYMPVPHPPHPTFQPRSRLKTKSSTKKGALYKSTATSFFRVRKLSQREVPELAVQDSTQFPIWTCLGDLDLYCWPLSDLVPSCSSLSPILQICSLVSCCDMPPCIRFSPAGPGR